MIALILALLGQAAELLNRLTTARAGKIDNLDATISSRAPSSTALSTATWDATKAGRLDAAISSRANVNVQQGTFGATAMSSGSGEDARFVDVTIAAVSSVSKAVPMFVGGATITGDQFQVDGGASAVYQCSARLTSATNLRISMRNSSTASCSGSWIVVDYGAP